MSTKQKYDILTPFLIVIISEVIFLLLFVAFMFFIYPQLPGIRLANKAFLASMVVIPMVIAIFFIMMWWRSKKLKQFGEFALVKRLIPDLSTSKAAFKLILLRYVLFFLILGLVNPQLGTKLEEVKREGIEMVIAVDLSNSMMAEDLSPNRLERAKRGIFQLIDKLASDKLGIVVFGGDAYVQLPITTDYAAAKLFVETIGTDIIPTQGTAIGAAIDLSLESFDFENSTSKVIVIITDGENHEDDAVAAAQEAAEKGVVVHTVGMGSSEGAPIPIYKGKKPVDFWKDKEGNTVMTALNEQMLQQIAAAGDGLYVRASNAQSGLNIVLEETAKMQKTEFGTMQYTDHEDRFQVFLFIALILLLIDQTVSDKRSWFSKLNLFGTK